MKLSRESIKIGTKLRYCGSMFTVIKHEDDNHRGSRRYIIYCIDEIGNELSFELLSNVTYSQLFTIFPKYSLLQGVKI